MKYRCGFPEWETDRPCDNPNEELSCDECTFGVEKEFGVWYRTEISRKQAKERIVREIESEKRRDAERILNRLDLIEHAVKGLDKRQFKIWRQLGALLRVVPDEKT